MNAEESTVGDDTVDPDVAIDRAAERARPDRRFEAIRSGSQRTSPTPTAPCQPVRSSAPTLALARLLMLAAAWASVLAALWVVYQALGPTGPVPDGSVARVDRSHDSIAWSFRSGSIAISAQAVWAWTALGQARRAEATELGPRHVTAGALAAVIGTFLALLFEGEESIVVIAVLISGTGATIVIHAFRPVMERLGRSATVSWIWVTFLIGMTAVLLVLGAFASPLVTSGARWIGLIGFVQLQLVMTTLPLVRSVSRAAQDFHTMSADPSQLRGAAEQEQWPNGACQTEEPRRSAPRREQDDHPRRETAVNGGREHDRSVDPVSRDENGPGLADDLAASTDRAGDASDHQSNVDEAYMRRLVDLMPIPVLYGASGTLGSPGTALGRHVVAVAAGRSSAGTFEVVGYALGARVDKALWGQLLGGAVDRGLGGVELVVTHRQVGIRPAVRRTFPGGQHQRCVVRSIREIAELAPAVHQPWVSRLMISVFDGSDAEIVAAEWARVRDAIAPLCTKIGPAMDRARDQTLAFRTFPADDWPSIWSTVPADEMIETIQRVDDWNGDLDDVKGMRTRIDSALAQLQLTWWHKTEPGREVASPR